MKNIINLQRRGYLTSQQVLVAHKFATNPRVFTLAPTLYRILYEIIVDEEPLEQLEARRGWPARSAKAILSILLHSMEEVRGSHEDNHMDSEVAEAQLEFLRADNAADLMPLVQEYGFTTREARLFLILKRAAGQQLGKEALLNRLYAEEAGDGPEMKIIDVFVCKIRKKLKGTPWRIDTIWGVGYRLIWDDTLTGEAKNDNQALRTRNLSWYDQHVNQEKTLKSIATEYSVAPSTVMRAIQNLVAEHTDEELDYMLKKLSANASEDLQRLTA